MRIVLAVFLSVVLVGGAASQDRLTTLSSDPDLIDAGLWDYVLPRFRLKTQVGVELRDGGDVSVALENGQSIFTDAHGNSYGVSLLQDTENATKLFDWLTSEIGSNTIASYQPDGVQIYFPSAAELETELPLELPGDPVAGKIAAQLHCGRCHVVSEENRFRGISSTPSFMALRTFDDWYQKFEVFWTLNPHPVFVQIKGVTPDFNPMSPPPIHPVMLTLDDVDNIGAYLVTVEPADLGAPIEVR